MTMRPSLAYSAVLLFAAAGCHSQGRFPVEISDPNTPEAGNGYRVFLSRVDRKDDLIDLNRRSEWKTLAINMVRLSRGKIHGVDHNKGLLWVGSSVGVWPA